jgi:hypothetical protein
MSHSDMIKLAAINKKFVDETKVLMKSAHLQMRMVKFHGSAKISVQELHLLTESLLKSQDMLEKEFEQYNVSVSTNIAQTNEIYSKMNRGRKDPSTTIDLLDAWSIV